MKKAIFKSVLFLLVGAGLSYLCYGLAGASGPEDTQTKEPTYWKKLAKAAPYELIFTPRLEDTGEYKKKPDFKELFTQATTRTLLLELKPITTALEKSGLAEPVLLELAAGQDDYMLTQVGKVTPALKNGKVVFNLPNVAPVNILKKYLDDVLQVRLQGDLPLKHPENCQLIFKDLSGNIKVKAEAKCVFPFEYEHPAYEQLARFLAKEEYEKAETFCSQLKEKEEIQNQCYRTLGDAFFENSDLPKAETWYEKSNYREGFDKIALAVYDSGDVLRAVRYFEKGTLSVVRAYAYAEAADLYQDKENNPEQAKTYYTKAITEFEDLVKSYRYTWNKKDSDERRRCIAARDSFPKTPEDIAQQERLARLLKKAAGYCDYLYNNFFHFFCEEVITEYADLSWDIVGTFATGAIPTTKDKYVYEYQLIKEEDGKIVEQRTLLKQNGATKNLQDAPLLTRNRYQKLIFGPIAFLGKSWQDSFDYKIVRDDTYKGEKVVVIEAIPKEFRNYNALVGNIWMKEDANGEVDILKLEWNPKTILENFGELLKLQDRFRAELMIEFFSEFDIKRKGFRLPSRYYIEEAYMKEDKKKFVRLKTEVIFRRHQYFSVSSEVISTERDK